MRMMPLKKMATRPWHSASYFTDAKEKGTNFLTQRKWDAVIVGGGHNGLTAAAYLAKSGLQVAVLERRPVLGGAAVTEELIPGFKFSRGSYLQSLLRPCIIRLSADIHTEVSNRNERHRKRSLLTMSKTTKSSHITKKNDNIRCGIIKKHPQNRAPGSVSPLQHESSCFSVNTNSNAHILEKNVDEPLEENSQHAPSQQLYGLEQEPSQLDHDMEQEQPQQEHGLEGEDPSIEVHSTTNVKRKGRGPTKCLFGNTTEASALPEIQFNERGQPFGPQSEKFSSFLCVLAREIVGIKHMEWKQVPEALKKDIWSAINRTYQIDLSAEQWCYKAISQCLRTYRYNLYKKYYLKYNTDEERMTNVPIGVNETDWIEFVRIRSDPKFKEKAKANQENRTLEPETHTSGRRGYFRVEHDLNQTCNQNDSPVTRADVWMKCHTKKDGTPMSSFSAERIKQIESIQNDSVSPAYATKEDAIAIVLGPERRGRVRGVGYGVTPTDLFGKDRAYKRQLHNTEEKLKEKNKELGILKAAVEELMQWKAATEAEKENGRVNPEPTNNSSLSLSQASLEQTPLTSGQPVHDPIGDLITRGQPQLLSSNTGLNGKKCSLTYFNGQVKVAKGYIKNTEPNFVMPNGEVLGEGYYFVCPQSILVDSDCEIKLKRSSSQCEYLADALNTFICWKSSDIELIND